MDNVWGKCIDVVLRHFPFLCAQKNGANCFTTPRPKPTYLTFTL